jgi:rubrerythrin
MDIARILQNMIEEAEENLDCIDARAQQLGFTVDLSDRRAQLHEAMELEAELAAQTPEPPENAEGEADELERVAVYICKPCLDGVEGVDDECHTPGCLFWGRESPHKIRDLTEWLATRRPSAEPGALRKALEKIANGAQFTHYCRVCKTVVDREHKHWRDRILISEAREADDFMYLVSVARAALGKP